MYDNVEIPLLAGMRQDWDARALEPPALLDCVDVQFSSIGGLQKRGAFTELLNGSTPGDSRRLAVYRDELLLFTKDKLFSWSPSTAAWVERGTHLAIKVEETSRMVNTFEQINCDRAELDGVVMVVYELDGEGFAFAALDAETGAVLGSDSDEGSNPKVIATENYLVVTAVISGALYAIRFDPSDFNISGSATELAANVNTTVAYDVEHLSGDTIVYAYKASTTTSYGVGQYNASTEGFTTSTKSRICTGAIAVAISEDGDVFVVRESPVVKADILSSALADTSNVDISIGASAATGNLTATVLNDSGGDHKCFILWDDIDEGVVQIQINTLDVDGTAGTAAELTYYMMLGSRAFIHDDGVYVWLSFKETGTGTAGLQNTYFLCKVDNTNGAAATSPTTVAKAVQYLGTGTVPAGTLPTVQNLGDGRFAFCATERRQIEIPDALFSRGYGARAPREVTFAFDSNEARRCVQLGETLYITGGQVTQYDGEQLTEVGFPIFPYSLSFGTDTGGDLSEGTYAYKATVRWENAAGEQERSTTALIRTITTVQDESTVSISTRSVQTNKFNAAVEIWRTAVDPTVDSPYYLATSKDPTATGANGYLANNPASSTVLSVSDELSDTDLQAREANPENGLVLENLPPPAATIIAASAERIFLAGVAHEPTTIWYSKLRGQGEVAAFHDALRITLPDTTGPITALAFLNDTLVAFTARAIYALPGQGFDNLGGGYNYGPARTLSLDVGATSADAVGLTPEGLIFFSSKGFYLLDNSFGVHYIGGPVVETAEGPFTSIIVLEDEHQVRCTQEDGNLLVYDYVVKQWSRWTVDADHSVLWNQMHVYTNGLAVFKPGGTPSYSMIVETGWIKLSGLNGFKRVRRFMLLGEEGADTHRIRVQVARNYSSSYTEEYHALVTGASAGEPVRFKRRLKRQKLTAVKFRISDVDLLSNVPSGITSLALTGIGLEVLPRQGLAKIAPATL